MAVAKKIPSSDCMVQLTLSVEEAILLKGLLGRVTHGQFGPDRIYDALTEAGIKVSLRYEFTTNPKLQPNTIRFMDVSDV